MSKPIKINIIDLDNKQMEEINLPSFIFSTNIKEEIVAKVVNWQLAKKRQGSHNNLVSAVNRLALCRDGL